jgi:MFS family permease
MSTENLSLSSIFSELSADARWLIVTRCLRLFAYGFLSVVLVFYLIEIGLDEARVGLLLSLTLVGDTLISLALTTRADGAGRRLTLVVGALLMTLAGVVFALTHHFGLLLAAGIVGVISPSGKEVGPFLSVEQAALAHVVAGERRTHVFAWYNLVASFAGAFGVLFAKWMTQGLRHAGYTPLTGYRTVVFAYAAVGLILAAIFARLGPGVEWRPGDAQPGGPPPVTVRFGLGHSRGVVLRLAGLFSIDAFAGGFVIDSLTIYWFHTRFGVGLALLGWLYFATNAVAGFSGLWAARLASRFGLINTMVFTHLPSNILLILVPLMPSLSWAAVVLVLRFSISQMDVPTRQAYTMEIVRPEERSAAAGVTGTARTIGAAIAPVLAGMLYARPSLAAIPFFIAGGLKIIYDLLLYRSFVARRKP